MRARESTASQRRRRRAMRRVSVVIMPAHLPNGTRTAPVQLNASSKKKTITTNNNTKNNGVALYIVAEVCVCVLNSCIIWRARATIHAICSMRPLYGRAERQVAVCHINLSNYVHTFSMGSVPRHGCPKLHPKKHNYIHFCGLMPMRAESVARTSDKYQSPQCRASILRVYAGYPHFWPAQFLT